MEHNMDITNLIEILSSVNDAYDLYNNGRIERYYAYIIEASSYLYTVLSENPIITIIPSDNIQINNMAVILEREMRWYILEENTPYMITTLYNLLKVYTDKYPFTPINSRQ